MTKRKIIILFALIGLNMAVFAQSTKEIKTYFAEGECNGKISKIKNVTNPTNKLLGEWDGEQTLYICENGKHYKEYSINLTMGKCNSFKRFDANGKVIEEFKRDTYYKTNGGNFTIKDWILSGEGLFRGINIKIVDGVLLSMSETTYESELKGLPDYIIPENKHFKVGKALYSSGSSVQSYYEFILKPIPFLVEDNKILKFDIVNSEWNSLSVLPTLSMFADAILKNKILDGMFIISNCEYNDVTKSYDKKVREERLYENGLLMWKIEYNKNGYAVIHTKYEYKKPFLLENENEIRKVLKKYDGSGASGTYYIEPSKNDYVETYEAYDNQNNIVASSELDKGIALQKQGQKEMANKLNTLKTEFNNLLGKEGLFTDPSANVKKLFNKLDSEYSKRIGQHFGAYADLQIPIKAEQAELYQSAINGLQKVGLKEFNKVCATITTKEELRKYLSSIK
jgi:hypothetical protein